MGQSFVSAIHTWGVHVKGPVYVSSFRPLSIAIAAATGVIFLGDDLHLGRCISLSLSLSGLCIIILSRMENINGPLYRVEIGVNEVITNYIYIG